MQFQGQAQGVYQHQHTLVDVLCKLFAIHTGEVAADSAICTMEGEVASSPAPRLVRTQYNVTFINIQHLL